MAVILHYLIEFGGFGSCPSLQELARRRQSVVQLYYSDTLSGSSGGSSYLGYFKKLLID